MNIKQRIVCTVFFALSLANFIVADAGNLAFLKVFISHTHKNCTKSLPANHQQFCGSFRSVAKCYCMSYGLSERMCTDMPLLYKRMLAIFDTVEKACEYQRDIPTQNCVDSWVCYKQGGKDSKKQLCASTGQACESSI